MKIVEIQEYEDAYFITLENGQGFLQRKYILHATDSPLTMNEEVIVALCKFALPIIGEE